MLWRTYVSKLKHIYDVSRCILFTSREVRAGREEERGQLPPTRFKPANTRKQHARFFTLDSMYMDDTTALKTA